MIEFSRQYELEVLVKGRPVHEYLHDSNVFIEGRDGSDFSVRIKNNSNEDIEAVLSVDGLSVLNGKEAGPDGPGYIVPARQSITVDGWTESTKKARQFYFAGRSEGYASRVDRGSNTGVIGVMAFRKKLELLQAWNNSVNNLTFGSVTSSAAGLVPRGFATSKGVEALGASEPNLGAGWGESVQQELITKKFERRDVNNPDAILAIYYDDRKGLERRGIILDRSKAYPDPFPTYVTDIGCKPPRR